MKKPKLLCVGDSIAHNAEIPHIEKVTKSRIRTEKSYSSINDKSARYPNQNFSKVTHEALTNTQKDDEFSHLILSAPTVDISNMDMAKLTSKDNIEVFKKKVVRSCENMFTVAHEALKKHPELKYVVLMEHVPRYDLAAIDPTGSKSKLAKLANSTFEQLWNGSAMKDNIIIGKHDLECSMDRMNAWYKDDRSGRNDGVHLYGGEGRTAFTKSMLEALQSVLTSSPPPSSYHSNQQERAQRQSRPENTGAQANKSSFSVPLRNKFDILGN